MYNPTTTRIKQNRITAINLHITGHCNMNCRMCFSASLRNGYMMPQEWVPVLELARKCGVEKVNFAGGEPTLYPHLKELAELAHHMGFYVSIISNGSMMDERWFQTMKGTIDCIGLSIDSPDENDEILIGRHVRGINHIMNVKKVLHLARTYGFRTKLNIVVNGHSYQRDFRPLIEETRSDRVKALRVLKLDGANENMPEGMWITDQQFDQFRRDHLGLGISFEDNEDMAGTYLMFDPFGNLMDNRNGEFKIVPLDEVLKNGIEEYVDPLKFGSRQEIYWRGPRIAVFGTSRSGKDYSIRDAIAILFAKGLEFTHISPITLVHNHLNGRRLKTMSETEKAEMMKEVREEIGLLSSSDFVFIDEHYCFPSEYGGKRIENGYSDEKLPFVILKDGNGGSYECVFDESWMNNYDLVLYMDVPSNIILDRFRESEGCKNNPLITLEDIEAWKSFEKSQLQKICSSQKLRMVPITDPEKSGMQISEAVCNLLND